jgi:hypothetical protein
MLCHMPPSDPICSIANRGYTPSFSRLAISISSHLKNPMLFQDHGGSGFQPGGMHLYAEDLKTGSHKNIGPKNFFEMVCSSNGLECLGRSCACLLTKGVPPSEMLEGSNLNNCRTGFKR